MKTEVLLSGSLSTKIKEDPCSSPTKKYIKEHHLKTKTGKIASSTEIKTNPQSPPSSPSVSIQIKSKEKMKHKESVTSVSPGSIVSPLIRPGPSEITYKHMRFLIMDRPTDSTLHTFTEVCFVATNKRLPVNERLIH